MNWHSTRLRAGFVAGQQLLDKLFPDVERRKQVGRDHLECLKYLCKEVWQNAFGKMIDNLKTNRKETFVMIDADFSWIKMFGEDARNQEITQIVILYLAFPPSINGVITFILHSCFGSLQLNTSIAQIPLTWEEIF